MDDERKAQLIEKHRDINVEHNDWWDWVYDDFTVQMADKHIEVQDIRFSGFWSQGDGASFTGYIKDNALFLMAHELTESYPWMTKLLGLGGDYTLKIERTSHHYVHENTVSMDLTDTCMFSFLIETESQGDLRGAIADRWDQHLDAEYATITEAAIGIIRGYCCDLYRRLEEEYNYLTSDEVVWETIQNNDLDTNEEENV